jgi:acylphosphatase
MSDRMHKHILVSGRVQGVGFRYYVKKHADLLGIVGFVRNLPGPKVEIDGQGSPEAMASFLLDVKRGPSAARVDELLEQTLPTEKTYQSFEIRHI